MTVKDMWFLLDGVGRTGQPSSMVSNLNPDIRMAKHRAFLDANWQSIAFFAYGEYLENGRGLVAIPEVDFIHAEEPRLTVFKLRYFPDAEIQEIMPDYEGSKEQKWVASYDPKERVIATIIRFDSTGVSSYLFGARPSPREIYEAGKAG